MIAYKDNNAPVVMQGNSVICNFDGKEAVEVSEEVGEALAKLGYRVEDPRKSKEPTGEAGDKPEKPGEAGDKPDEEVEGNGGSDSITEVTNSADKGSGRSVPSGDGKGGNKRKTLSV